MIDSPRLTGKVRLKESSTVPGTYGTSNHCLLSKGMLDVVFEQERRGAGGGDCSQESQKRSDIEWS